MRFDAKQLQEMSRAVRAHALDAVRHAGSGHVGIVLGASDIITTIYANFLRRGRDRFVLSAGHGSAMLYAVLKLAGYNVGDLNSFRKLGGLPGHPEYGIDGVFATTGPLGQGVGNAVGMALAEKIRGTDGIVYCLCSDGDLSEGVAAEAITFAGRYKLDNLVLIWDDNGISIDGNALTDIDVPERMRAAGWRTTRVRGDDFNKLNRALQGAPGKGAPVFIAAKTIIGRDSSVAGTPAAHGLGLSDAEMMLLVEKNISPTGDDLWTIVAGEATAKYALHTAQVCPTDVPAPDLGDMTSTRELSGAYLQSMIAAGCALIGGSADLGHSTNARVAASVDIKPPKYRGNYINYGVREHAMGAIMNGLASAGLRPYGSTFLVFSDYMRPSIRLAAMSGLPVIYVFAHDSVAVGADGPTHQPVEQLPALRLIPNLNVYRPCNGAEVAWAWSAAIADAKRPSAIILSRQKFIQIKTHAGADISRGGYIIYPATARRVRATILATGAEVALAVAVAKKLGDAVQVASIPSVADFRAQDDEYKSKILAGYVVAIEAAATAPWFEFADAVVGIDSFGVSGAGSAVYSHFGFDTDLIARDILKKIK